MKKILSEAVDGEEKRKPLTDEKTGNYIKFKRVSYCSKDGCEISRADGFVRS